MHVVQSSFSSADKELKFSRKKRISEYGIVSHSTIGVIFRLPDAAPESAAITVAPIVTRRKLHKIREPDTAGKVEKDERRPELRRWHGKIELTNRHPDFMDDELSSDLYRAIMPCGHVIGNCSELPHHFNFTYSFTVISESDCLIYSVLDQAN